MSNTVPENENTVPNEGADNVSVVPASQPDTGNEEQGFPVDTPIAEMTLDEQVAYWKHKARKHEGRANAREDYDKIKSELDEFRRAQQTDAERAVEDARREGRQAALAELGAQGVDAHVNALVFTERLSEEQAQRILHGMNKAAFIEQDGSVDLEALKDYLDAVAPQATNPPRRDPHQGFAGETGRASGLTAGSELFKSKKGK